MFSVKSQTANIFCFADHTVSADMTQLGHFITKAVADNMKTDKYGCGPIKRVFKNRKSARCDLEGVIC